MRISGIILATLFTVTATTSFAQMPTVNPNTKISVTSFQTLAQSCAANVPVSTLEAIARTESALYPYALSINRPHQLAHRQGWNRGTIALERQPASLEEAIAWTHWLVAKGITVSIRLLQVNNEHAALLTLAPISVPALLFSLLPTQQQLALAARASPPSIPPFPTTTPDLLQSD